MDNTEEKLFKVPIAQMVKFAHSFAGAEIHISISGKYVRMNYATDDFLEILRKLQQKDVDSVYIRQGDLKRVMDQIQEGLSSKQFYDPKITEEEKIEVLDHAMKTVKNVINQLGVDQETVALLRQVSTRAMNMLSESPSLYAFINRFRKNCSEQFLRAMLTSYVMSLVIDKFAWSSEAVKEKGAMASLMCDLMLDKEDFEALREYELNGGTLPEHIRNHPIELAEKLRVKRDVIPSETITIIEQHHELPSGKGFPSGLTSSRINQLAAIFIVSQRFIEHLFDENFDYEKRFDITTRMLRKYEGKTFEKAIDALIRVVT